MERAERNSRSYSRAGSSWRNETGHYTEILIVSPRTTKLYDRTKERLTQDEVERIRL
jgi:hypothetical protein